MHHIHTVGYMPPAFEGDLKDAVICQCNNQGFFYFDSTKVSKGNSSLWMKALDPFYTCSLLLTWWSQTAFEISLFRPKSAFPRNYWLRINRFH